jgi:3-methylcrotonyl-CoA carboxylase alpha subunit
VWPPASRCRCNKASSHARAIEARICAENPEADFLPATGTLAVVRWPEHVAFCNASRSQPLPRVDSGVRQGDAITPYYDSMIAKLIVWGEDREQALARLDAALAATHIVGLHTNVAFLRRAAASRAFASADLDTALIERERAALFGAPPLPMKWAAAGVLAHAQAHEAATQGADPWSHRHGFRLHGGARRRLELMVAGAPGGERVQAVVERMHDGATVLHLAGEHWQVASREVGPDQFELELGGVRARLAVYAQGEHCTVFGPGGSVALTWIDPLAHAGDGAGPEGRLTAPMPGKVVAFLAEVGQAVTRGQALAVMEAMKMEHTITAPSDGVVQELLYAVGDQVAEGGELLKLAPA